MSAIRPIELVPLYIPNAIVMNCVGPQYPIPPGGGQHSTVLRVEGDSRGTPDAVQTLGASDQPVPSLPTATFHMPTPEPVPAVDQAQVISQRPEDGVDEAGADFLMPVITEVVSLAADASSSAEWRSNDPGPPGHLASLPVQENRVNESFGRGNYNAGSVSTASGSSPRVRKSTGDRKYERKLVAFEVGMPATATVQFPTPAPYVPPQPVYINPLPAFVSPDSSKVFILEKTGHFSGHRSVARVMHYAQPDTTAPNMPSSQTSMPQGSVPAPATSGITCGTTQLSGYPSVAATVHYPQAGTTAPSTSLIQGNNPQGSAPAHATATSCVTDGTAQVLGYPSVTAVMCYPQAGTTAPDMPSSQPPQAFPTSACYTPAQPQEENAVQASRSPNGNCTARPNIMSKSLTKSVRGNQNPTRQKEATAQKHTRNRGLLESILKNGKKKERLASPAGKKKGPSQSPASRAYPTQVWTRTLPSVSSSTSDKAPAVPDGKGVATGTQQDPGPSSSAGMSVPANIAAENPRVAPVLNIPWVRLVVTSDVVSPLSLDDVRNSIEKFLVRQQVPENVCRDGALYLHWDGKDLGTFQFKDASCRVLPQSSVQEHIVISSSDDEEAEVACKRTAPLPRAKAADNKGAEAAHKRTAPLPRAKAASPKQQNRLDIGELYEPEVILEETACSPRANAASLIQPNHLDVRELLEPEVILEEQPDAQLELPSLESSSSDSEESVQSSVYDPTYSPEEELQDLSDDELYADSDDTTTPKRELRNRRQRVTPSSETASTMTITPEQQRGAGSNKNAAERKQCGGTAESAEAALLSDPPETSHREEGTSEGPLEDLETAQPTTSCQPVAAVPIDMICKPCCVDLFRINESMLISGSVNLSVVREEELFIKDQSAEVSSWARLANALSLFASGDLQL